mgnify:CR=1 FL=1
MKYTSSVLSICLTMVFISGCQTTKGHIMSEKPALELRSMQSRAFETPDQNKVYRAIIYTFQDLGYSINKVEPEAGTVSASKLAQIWMTATVYPRGDQRTIVRSNAIVKVLPTEPNGFQVDSPEFYQQRFFEPLEKALFLSALQIEDPAIIPENAEFDGQTAIADTKDDLPPEVAE